MAKDGTQTNAGSISAATLFGVRRYILFVHLRLKMGKVCVMVALPKRELVSGLQC